MYTKDKSNRITLRLNEEQFAFVKTSSDYLGVSPSEFLRMVVNLAMCSNKAVRETDLEKTLEECIRRENENANSNNQL